ncbi:hypothetical protein STEG23_010068 [Scotinomys teguina]
MQRTSEMQNYHWIFYSVNMSLVQPLISSLLPDGKPVLDLRAPLRTDSHPRRKRTQEQPISKGGRGPRSRQSPSEEEDQETASHLRRKRIQDHPDTIGTRDLSCPPSKVEMGRRQCKSKYNNMKNKTSPESSPPPTPRPDHCNVEKAEENDLKNSLMKMIQEALEGKMKDAIKEIEEKTNKN